MIALEQNKFFRKRLSLSDICRYWRYITDILIRLFFWKSRLFSFIEAFKS